VVWWFNHPFTHSPTSADVAAHPFDQDMRYLGTMNSGLTVIGAGHAQCRDTDGAAEWGGESETCAACCQVPQPASPWRLEVTWNEHRFEVPVCITLAERKKGNGGTQ
jgi:hypothetical protein